MVDWPLCKEEGCFVSRLSLSLADVGMSLICKEKLEAHTGRKSMMGRFSSTRLQSAVCLACRSADPWRAMLSKTPTAASEVTSEEPPKLTKGKGTPVKGMAAATEPMLIAACAISHVVIPQASSAPKVSGARRPAR